ncbi:hypothetical protein DCS_02483 [Drechmeria coniospora]|uniref:Uncharacterized protein n=1 Tax=Drechmeria coniospora TaxID=98403 RepID=A0A151GW97_DRECN|nr:hypothetical protein DCS_02483 [Drechmeria coniospora]KYK61341.1 hypothetical protein DCS_02483 [Drechmeria coniospora]
MEDTHMAYGNGAGTLFRIYATENIIELTGSLPATEVLRQEIRLFLMLGGAWDAQIIESATLAGGKNINFEEKIDFVPIKNFDPNYYQHDMSVARPRLAGLPLNDPALANGESRMFSNVLECDKEARAYIDSIAEYIGWVKTWPLVVRPAEAAIAARAVATARNIISDARKAALEAEKVGDLVAASEALTMA